MKTKIASITLSVLSALFLASVTPAPTPAQGTPAQPQVLRNPAVNYPVHSDISRPLSQMATVVLPQQAPHQAPAVRYPKSQSLTSPAQLGLAPLADGALQTSSGPLISTSPGLNLLGVGNGFPNYTVPDAPSDVNLAVGDTQVVQWVNVSYAVFDKATGAVIAGPIEGNQFWAGFGGPCEASNSGDIIAQWDKIAHRWFMAQNVYSAPYYTCVAISKTADATGPYYRFQFNQSYGFPDYPKWGIWPDAYYQSVNNFGPSGSTFLGAIACAYERAKMLVGDSTAKQICFTTSTSDDSLLPGDLDSAATLPPTGQDEVYLGSIDTGTSNIYEYLFHVDFTTPSNSTFTGVGGSMPVPGVSAFSLACGTGSRCIPQNGVPELLDSLGDRLMYRLAYRNFPDHQTWLVSHSLTAGSSVGERWYEFRAPESSTSLSVFQQGTFAPDSNYRWMGSIAMDGAQDIALGYSISSSSMFPSINYTGRVPSDLPGTMENETQIVAGTGSQTNGLTRWGDYTSMAIDAADDCTFWYTNQYLLATGSFNWSTRLASFKFPGCGQSLRPTTAKLAASPASSTYGALVTFTATVAPTSGTGTPTGTVTFSDGGTNLGTGTLDAGGTATVATSTLSVGSGSVTATYGGGPTFGGSASTPLAYTVAKAGTTTSVSSNNSSSPYGQSVTFTATVSPPTVAGTVTFKDGAAALGTVALSSGKASFSTSNLAVGSHPITTTYNGNSNYNTSTSGSVTLTVSQATSTTSLASSINPSTLGQSVTFTVTVSPSAATGTVQLFDGTNPLGTPTTLSGGKASVSTTNLAVGSHSITATYSGDANDIGSTSSTLTQTVNAAPAGNFSLSATPSTQTVVRGNGTTYTATVSALNGFAGTVSLSASGLPTGAHASFNPSSITTTTTGSSTMTVTTGSTTPTGSFTITVTGTSGAIVHNTTVALVVSSSADFTLSASPSSLSIARRGSGTTTITITPSSGSTPSVRLSASSLPGGVTASFGPNPATTTSTLTLTASSTATTGTVRIRVRGTSGSLTHSIRVSLTVQ